MKKHNKKFFIKKLFLVFFTALILFINACATIPKNSLDSATGDFDLLPSGGDMYMWANVAEVTPLLKIISFDDLNLKDASAILDRTDTAAAVFTGSGSERFFINTRGKYPTFQAGFSLTFSRDWKKIKNAAGNPYWNSKKFGVGLVLDSQTSLVSTGDPFARLPSAQIPPVRIPLGFDEFRKGAVMSGWIADPQKVVNDFLVSLGIPIQLPAEDFFFNIEKSKNVNNEDLWELVFFVRTPSVNQARALTTLFALARVFIGTVGGNQFSIERKDMSDFLPALFYNQPEREDAALTLRSDVFTTEDMSLLFHAISVYSKSEE